MELAAILVGDRRDMDDAPERSFAAVPADQHGEELGNVEAVALGTPEPAIDLDAGGVDDDVGATLGGEITVKPEAVAPRLVARDDAGVFRQPEPLFGSLDLGVQDLQAARRHGSKPRFLSHAGGEGEVPGGPCQLKGEVERGNGGRCRMRIVGRWHGKAP